MFSQITFEESKMFLRGQKNKITQNEFIFIKYFGYLMIKINFIKYE